MTTTIRLIGAFFVALCLASFSTPADLSAQGKGGGKGGGGGGKSDDTPVIIVFRDAESDRLGSECLASEPVVPAVSPPCAYIDGELGIDYAHFRDSGQLYLGFIQPKRKSGDSERHLYVDLTGDPFDPWTNDDGSIIAALRSVYEHNAFFQIAVRNVGFRNLKGGAEATFNIRYERTSALQWGITYSGVLFDHALPDRVWVQCWDKLDGECIAWRVDKDDNPLAAVTGGGTKDDPAAGAWKLPFGIAVCLRDVEPFASAGDPGAKCKSHVFGT